MPDLHALRHALRSFAQSPFTFQIINSFPSQPAQLTCPTNTLYILDSSFNPPTLAHLRICTSALLHDKREDTSSPRLLLLLATQNADKAPKPAAFEQRLAMMSILAENLQTKIHSESGGTMGNVGVDVGVTKVPRFVEKVDAIENSGPFSAPEGVQGPVEQVHLIGFDTLVRLLDTKYYPPDHTLQPLNRLFAKGRVRVTRRTDDAWGGGNEQVQYVRSLAEGRIEDDGGKKEWAEKIELVEGRPNGEEIISSTKVRNAAKNANKGALEQLVARNVASWILDEKLYMDED